MFKYEVYDNVTFDPYAAYTFTKGYRPSRDGYRPGSILKKRENGGVVNAVRASVAIDIVRTAVFVGVGDVVRIVDDHSHWFAVSPAGFFEPIEDPFLTPPMPGVCNKALFIKHKALFDAMLENGTIAHFITAVACAEAVAFLDKRNK